MKYLPIASLAAAMLISPLASAEKLFSDSSISLLYSDQYQAFGRNERTDTYVTFENVTAHDWGGTFCLWIVTKGEVKPMVTTICMANSSQRSALAGYGVDLQRAR